MFHPDNVTGDHEMVQIITSFFSLSSFFRNSSNSSRIIDNRNSSRKSQAFISFNSFSFPSFKRTYSSPHSEVAEMLFSGVNSFLTLKKRYKDLMKMFHPYGTKEYSLCQAALPDRPFNTRIIIRNSASPISYYLALLPISYAFFNSSYSLVSKHAFSYCRHLLCT